MATINKILCAEAFGNTGAASCSLVPVNMVGAFLAPLGEIITQAQANDLTKTLQDAAERSNPLNRIYPIHGFTALADNSEEDVVSTLGYGGRTKIRPGFYDWMYEYVLGGICTHNELIRLSRRKLGVYFYDAKNVLYGRNIATGIGSIPLEFFDVPKWSANDGSVEVKFNIQFSFAPKYLNENIGFLQTDIDFTDIKGLQTANLQAKGAQTTTVLNVEAVTSCGGDNLYNLFDNDLAVGGLWSVRDSVTGNVLLIDSVAANPTTGTWTITLDQARTGAVIVGTTDLQSLISADVTGYEFKQTLIPMP